MNTHILLIIHSMLMWTQNNEKELMVLVNETYLSLLGIFQQQEEGGVLIMQFIGLLIVLLFNNN